jgi:putative membrane protein insertion efficiency factor
MTKLLINLIKIYRFLLSPLLGNKCRYLPTCSEYCIDSLKRHGLTSGSYLGIKRIFKCHPFKFLGGGSGLDFVPKKKELKKKNFNG